MNRFDGVEEDEYWKRSVQGQWGKEECVGDEEWVLCERVTNRPACVDIVWRANEGVPQCAKGGDGGDTGIEEDNSTICLRGCEGVEDGECEFAREPREAGRDKEETGRGEGEEEEGRRGEIEKRGGGAQEERRGRTIPQRASEDGPPMAA